MKLENILKKIIVPWKTSGRRNFPLATDDPPVSFPLNWNFSFFFTVHSHPSTVFSNHHIGTSVACSSSVKWFLTSLAGCNFILQLANTRNKELGKVESVLHRLEHNDQSSKVSLMNAQLLCRRQRWRKTFILVAICCCTFSAFCWRPAVVDARRREGYIYQQFNLNKLASSLWFFSFSLSFFISFSSPFILFLGAVH